MRTAKRILAEFMTVVMVLQACSPTVAAVAAGWQNISNEIAAASAKALDTAESGETNGDAANGFGSSDTGAAGDSAQDGAAKDDVATGDTVDSAAGSDSTGDQTEGDDAAGDAAADDVEQDADAAVSEDAEAQAGSTITDLKKLVELLEANGAEGIELKEDNSGIKSLNVTSSEAFAALSNADASLYYDAQIKVIITGDAKLTESANNGMSFQGFGSDEHPFEGRIYRSMNGADSPVELTTNRTVFNNLKLTDQNNTVKIKWVGATTYSAPMIASKVSGGGKTLNAVVNIANSVGTDGTDTTSALTAPLLGEAMGDLTTEVTYGPAGSLEQLNVNAAGNIGLLANTVKSGTFTVGSVKFPDSLAAGGVVKTSSGNAGLLVGTVEDGATLNVGTLDVPAATVQSASGSAGGVVGLVGSNTGATVNVTEALDLHMLTVKGTTASGGFIGKATKLTLGADSKKYTCPASVGNENSMNTGGFIGEVSFASSVEFTGNDQIDTDGGVTLAGKANESNGVGAAIGKLSFVDSAATVSFKGGAFKSTYGNGGGTAVFGGLVGSVTGCANSKPLHIENVSTKFALEATPTFAGGLVGWLGRGAGATLEVKNATVNCTKLLQSSKGFGGVAGCIDNRSIADINGVTVKNEGAIENGAGIAAESWGSAIRLGGVTDFSGMKFAPDNSFTYKKVVSQITNVSSSNPTLVFARGTGSDSVPADADNADCWAYKRCPATKIDDLGSDQNAGCGYGEIVRLDGHTLRKDLIKINMDKHELEGPSTTDWSWQVGYGRSWNDGNRELTITSEKDFACFALSLQFGALWNGVYGLNPDNRGQLLGSNVTINLSANINLLGTGIGGLGFDNASNLQIFQGTFNGNGHTITLGVGEPYGIRGDNAIASNDTSDGNGKIYRHSRLGLFAAIGGGATVNNLTVDGVMKFDNGLGVDAGSLAATITGDATLNSVMCNAAITCDDSFGNDVNIGGIAGSVRGGGTVTFSSSNTGGSTKAQATVKTGATLNGNTCIGGAVGYVADVVAIVNVASLEVGDAPAGENAITAGDSASNKKSQIGGLIGCITQGIAANATNVNITGLTFNSFSMTVGKNGDAKSGAGGLLGYSWGNTVVTIGDSSKNTSDSTYALKTNNASITANSSGELGGLVYAASGQWVINNYAIDLSGATINAKSATTLGLLVGRGSKVASGVYGSESYTGLYLEDRAYWGTAYKVSGIKITAPDITTFDEWVGNGVKPGSKLMDGEWNTVVSLHTKDDVNEGKLDMSGEKGSDNSYHNRSDFGKNHNTNAWTRYYYNLDKAYAKVGNNPENNSRANFMDSPEYLLLWCAYLYAPSDIRSYIIPGNQQIFQGNNIGTNDGTRVSIDMNGYSFYPSNPASGSKVTVKNADIKFHYSKIKAEQNGNKKNSEATQHENMHCGLIRTHAGDLTVNNVTLGGTVGSLVKDAGSSSGALVCRYIYGSSTSVKQISIDNLTLDGLTVDGVTDKTDYAPLLINEMQTYVNLNATNISTKGYGGDTKAATSLFGRLGVGSTADQVTATFSAISLPSATDNAMFTRASLLESFGYGEGKTGSAVYTFMKDDQTNEKVTFGSEIDSKGEYSGKQLWYYDESTYGTPAGLVTVDNKEANADTPQFGGYLPYVKKGNVNENKVQYHEIKVNQRVPKLTTGCGTYGDPYAITKASELNTVAEYINTQNAIDGWEVTIAANQEELCQRRSSSEKPENEVTYIYKQAKKKWEKKTGEGATDPNNALDDATMHSYLQSAYYSIEPVDSEGNGTNTLVLDTTAFQGLGNQSNPFRGVVVGDLGSSGLATIKINKTEGASALSGLIRYSYGSVVSNLNIEYSGTPASIAYKSKDTSGSGVPGAFFGGVIGCIMGGDNIIDGVSVNTDAGFSVAGAAGDNGGGAHLVPVGGYVGAVAGGGVIFRNSSHRDGALNDWHGTGASLYDNPYVGRVIDGYAFSELADSKRLNNTDRNYKVNNLDTSKTNCIETGATQGRYRGDGTNNNLAITTTVNDSQGLLVLSAIISSGAAGGSANTNTTNDAYGTYAGSRAYMGGGNATGMYKFGNQQYGKVRNASYTHVGRPASAADDFANAKNDDMKSPGIQEGNALDYAGDGLDVNSPYLVSKYATWQTGNICAAQVSGMDLRFVNTDKDIDYDMTPYGTGYTGLSGRYYSNACASGKGADRDRIVPLVACINGNGAKIKVGSKAASKVYGVTEYADDNYKLTGVGALFGTVTYASTNVRESIGTSATDGAAAAGNGGYTVQNLKFDDCNISLTYINAAGAPSGAGNEQVGVGLLAGTTANASSLADYGKYAGITMDNCRVNGPNNAGGLLGASGYGSRRTDKDTTLLVNRNDTSNSNTRYSPVKLYDCSYSNMDISGVKNVGGFVGKLNQNSAGGVWTKASTPIAKNSTIMSTASNARTGGVVGLAGGGFLVNTDDAGTPSQGAGKAEISNVTLQPAASSATEGTGGLIGRSENGIVSVYNLCIQGDVQSKTVFGVRGSNNLKYVAGAVGEAASGGAFKFDSCVIKDIYLGARECSAGLIGDLKGGCALEVKNSTITGLVVDGSYSGGVVGSIGNTANSVTLLNSTIGENNFTGSKNAAWNSSLGSCSGGVSGDGRGSFRLVNVLMDRNIFGAQTSQGYLFGNSSSADLVNVFVAGIAIRPNSASESLKLMRNSSGTDDLKKVNKKSYIAFAAYEDKLSDAKGATLYGNDAANGNVTAAVSPYVTTSPTSGLAVRASDADTAGRYLFGDGMNVGLATAIQNPSSPGVANRYTYTNIGGINDDGAYQNTSSYNAKSVASMFNANNDASDSKVATDFPVLVISGTDNTTVKSYLNIITNGGFSDACRLNNENGTNPHVTAKAEVFQLKNGVFVKDDGASSNPTLRVVNNGKKNMSFSPSSDWDNGKGRFTLLTVTFTEAGQSYNVQVPIIVKRKLEIDFTATYDYGTKFKESDYANLGRDAHVLTSFGEPMTGLLTWTYNSANGTEVDFGWDSYMAAGGSMKGLGKSILFNGADGRLPQGTQLTLVDANVDGKAGGREYHYTVGEGGATSASLSGDAGFEDSAGNPYQERWLSEILGVSATKDGAGTWVACENEAEATAKAKIGDKWTLFKVAGANVPSNKRYTLKVPKEKDTGREKRASESVYLVVNVPKSGDGGTQASINGFTASSIDSNSSGARISWNLHHVLRTGGEDNQNSTASTYSILSNYEQSVVDNKNAARIPVSKSEDGAAYVLSLDVKDRVTFSPSQYYTESDHLFYQLDTSLCRYGANNNLMGVSSFPSGTSAIAKFYVAIGGQNYRWNGGDWEPCDASMPAFTQTVTDTGDDSLKLTLDHDLAGIRKIATDGSFTVHTVVEEIRLTPDGCNKVISLSKQSGEDACTKMSYTAKLSTRKEGLNTSSLTQTKPGNVGYYRMDTGDTTITLSAPDKSQLGINVDDLRPIANGTIGLGATYELGGLSNAAEAIANADSVVYTLELQRRGTDGTYESVTDDISNYVTVTESKLAAVAPSGSTITFTDSKENGKFKTQNGDTTFSLPFTVKVNTQVEQREQFYANYRLVMRASLVKGDVASAKPQSPDYVTYTLTRVNLNGIDH
ncbi:hypothetical protein DW892_05605 [Collinsella sp. AM40-7AC]|uniref:hypothetical protein n=1 Tax=Collinsella TaxID=102106 RepID=UPI000E536EDE|nr:MULTISPECIES: hypothetical protein [Collinsella]RHB18268.1 hypothetical protein DW892_05605 [Collinsella sp. AM40-7AC]